MNYIAQSPAVPLADLSHFACHYPLGDPRDEGFGYCGAAAKIGSRYCERHHRLCYTTSADRLGIEERAPEIAGAWTDQRDHSEPLTIWRPRARNEAPVSVAVTYESLIAAKKERDARMRAAAIDTQKEIALRKKREDERLQAEAEKERPRQRQMIVVLCAVASLLRGFAEGLRGGPEKIRIDDIQKLVASHYSVSRADILSSRRTAAVVKPRQVAMFLAKMLTLRSLPEIGRRFGGRDHTTVLHAVRKIGALIETDAELRAEIDEITRRARGRRDGH